MTSDKNRVAIIDYGMGNLYSVKQACAHSGMDAFITSDRKKISESVAAILPGVGAFGDAMVNLEKLDIIGTIKEFIDSGKPFMGICLGLQLMMTESEEFGSHKGLDIFRGSVVRFSEKTVKKIPQVGWNNIYLPEWKEKDAWDSSPLKGLSQDECMYFVHSYYVIPEDENNILALTSYEGTEYCSAIKCRNVFACQFHPEKSADRGLSVYRNMKLEILERRSR